MHLLITLPLLLVGSLDERSIEPTVPTIHKVALTDLRAKLDGDRLPSRFEEPTSPGIRARIRFAVSSWSMTAPPTETQRRAYDFAAADFETVLAELRQAIEEDLRDLQRDLDDAGVPWTAGRLPVWEKDQPTSKRARQGRF